MKWFAIAVVFSGPAVAQQNLDNEVSDEVIAFWAKSALPLAKFVERGFGMAQLSDVSAYGSK